MNEEYVKAFVENFKRKFADVASVNIELETLIAFKDAEIAALKAEVEKYAPAPATAPVAE